MNTAKLLNIAILDMSYEEGPAESDNNGANDDQNDAHEEIDIKEEFIDNLDESCNINKSDENFISEKNIIGTAENASFLDRSSSLPKMSSSQVSSHLCNYICSVCDAMFPQMKALQIHMDTHSSEAFFPCEVCGKSFKLMTTLKFHKLSHDNPPLPKQKKNSKSLREDLKHYSCLVCPQSFVKKENLNQHIKIHTGLEPYICSNCGKGFSTKLMKNNHLSKCVLGKDIETKDKNDIVEKKLEHGLKDIKEKPDVEHVSFNESMEVFLPTNQNSVKIVKSKTYNCPYCNSKYYSVSAKNMHIKKKHPENINKVDKEIDGNSVNLKCNACQKRFASQHSLEKHMITGCEKSFQCPFCPLKFSQAGNRKRHLNNKHPKENNKAAANKQQELQDPKSQENETNNSILIHKCNYCTKAFHKEKSLKSHVNRCQIRFRNNEEENQKQGALKSIQNTENTTTELSDKEDNFDLKCDECGTRFSKHKGYMKHLALGICLKFECPLCADKFKQEEDLDWHISINHDVSDVE